MNTFEIGSSALHNCCVEPQTEQGMTLFRLAVTDPAATQLETERNKDFETDRSSVLASFCLECPREQAPAMAAVYQHKSWWIRPAFPENWKDVPERTQLLIWKEQDAFCVLLAVCDGVIRTDFSGLKAGIRVEISTNGCPGDSQKHICAGIARGNNPYECIHALVAAAAEAQGRSHILRENKVFPEMFRSLGWCTWDAFYHKVNEQDIFKKLKELQDREIPVRWMLIDDGWSDADYETRKLNDITADPVKFPEGLHHTVKVAKEQFGLEQVGVWHALMGYWTGFNPDTPAFRHWEKQLIKRNEQDYVLMPEEETVFSFYDSWHAWLEKECGIDFVKVDGQGSGSLYYKGIAGYGASAGGYLRALERSTQAHFHGNLVNCMGMAPENMWLREHSSISRSSDDFVPQVPHGFREHALQNSFNSLLQGQFFWGDWDMFWSSHVESRRNSVLRAVSGGPVYISDQLDQTDGRYIFPLLGWDKKLILCDDIGVPTMDCLVADPLHRHEPFKIFNRYGNGYVVAVFNINADEQTCAGRLSTEDIPGLAGKEWLVYRHFGKRCDCLRDGEAVTLELEANDAELLLVLPKKADGQMLGDPAKYVGSYAVLEEQSDAQGIRARVSPAESVVFVPAQPVRAALVNGKAVTCRALNGCWEIPCGSEPAEIEIRY